MASLVSLLRRLVGGAFALILVPIAVDYFKKANPTAADYETTWGGIVSALGGVSKFAVGLPNGVRTGWPYSRCLA